jgi:hypothetical protein
MSEQESLEGLKLVDLYAMASERARPRPDAVWPVGLENVREVGLAQGRADEGRELAKGGPGAVGAGAKGWRGGAEGSGQCDYGTPGRMDVPGVVS